MLCVSFFELLYSMMHTQYYVHSIFCVQREAGNVAWQQGDLTTALVNYSRQNKVIIRIFRYSFLLKQFLSVVL